MKTENEKYTELVEHIKRLQPVISDTEVFASKILQHIEDVPQKKFYSKTLTIVSWSSSIAASLLIGLFLFEYFKQPTTTGHTTCKRPSIYTHFNINDGNQTLTDFNDWIHIKKERQKREQAYYSNKIQ